MQKNDIKPQVDGRYLSRLQQMEKFKAQHEASVRAEERLAALSKFSFNEVDYSLLVQRSKWKTIPFPDYSYMYDEAKKIIESRYKILILGRIVFIILLMCVLLFVDNIYILGGGFLIELLVLLSLMLTVKNRQRAHKKAIIDVTQEIEKLREQNRIQNQNGRQKLEEQENERLRLITDLLDGQTYAIASRLEDVLNRVSLPFPLKIDIYIMDRLPFIKVWLPGKTIIPTQTSSIDYDGQVVNHDKDKIMINKQYLEVCFSVLIQIMSKIYANIQVFDEGYLCAYLKNTDNSSCVAALNLSRQAVQNACRAGNGIAAIQSFEGNYQWNTDFEMMPVAEIQPPKWNENDAKGIQSVHINIMG